MLGGVFVGYSIFEDTMVDMTWLQVKECAAQKAIVLLPLGVIEEHGPHMCLGVDTYLSVTQCRLVKKALEQKKYKAIIAPPFYWGINSATGGFPGSFSSRKETVEFVIYDIISSLKSFGFNDVFGINAHGDPKHCSALIEAFHKASTNIDIKARYIIPEGALNRYGLSGKEAYILSVGSSEASSTPSVYSDIHAGDGETATMSEYYPGLVDLEIAKSLKPTSVGAEELGIWIKGGDEAIKITPEGFFGDPAGYEKVKVDYEGFAKFVGNNIISSIEKSV